MTSVSISTTKNTVTVDEDNPSVITVATQGPQGPAFSDGDLGDIVISGNGTIATIDNGVVNNAKIASDAAIALSKLATGALPTAITVTSANISDLSILNADVNASAAIAGTKISPDFGSQNIVTTGNITIADVTAASLDISGNADIDGTLEADAYTVNGTALNEYIADTIGAMVSGNTETNIAVTYDDADNTLDFSVVNITGNAATATALETARTIGGTSFDGSANIDISYNNLTNKLSVGDGGLTQNNFTDTLKTKLDGIETAATADQTAAEILTALKTVDGSTSGLDADLLDGRDTSNSGTANTIALRDANGDLFATTFSGSGASLTSLPASQLTGAIANGVTATTQSASDNSTKVATTAYADTAIANLVDSSPSALNTLNELAAALGDDANFSTTVTNNIATKLSLSGGTLTGTLELDGDLWLDASGTASRDVFWDSSESIFRFYNSAKATFGNSDDLQIYHDGTNSWIKEAGTNRLIIDTDGQGIDLTKTGATEYLLRTAIDGAVELYYDGAKKLETTSGGISMSGEIHLQTNHLYGSDNAKIRLGGAQDLQIYHDGTYNTFAGANFLVRNAAANESLIYAVENGAAELWYDNSKKLETATWGTQIHGVLATTSHVDIASDSGILKLGASADLQIYHDGSHSHIVNSTGNLRILADGAGDLVLTSKAGEEAIKCVQDGNVQLMYDNSKKLETTSTGVLVTELTNSGNTTFNGSYVTFSGTNTAAWDKSNTRLLFNDNAKAAFGTGVDLTIYHGGTNSIIENITGDLYFKNTNNFFLQVNASEAAIYARPNAAVELYYDASKKLETKSAGITVYGEVGVTGDFRGSDNSKFISGDSSDLQIYHNGTYSEIKNTTGGLYLENTGEIGLISGTYESGEWMVKAVADGAVGLYYDANKKLETQSWGTSFTGNVSPSATNSYDLGASGAQWQDLWIGNDIHVADSGIAKFGNSGDLQIYHAGDWNYIDNIGTKNIVIRVNSTDNAFVAIPDGAVQLYYDHGNKLQTTSTGINVTGVVVDDGATHDGDMSLNGASYNSWWDKSASAFKFDDNAEIRIGTGGDLQLYHNGSDSYINDTGTGALRVVTSDFQVRNSANTELVIQGIENAAVNLYYNGAKKLETTLEGTKAYGNLRVSGAEGSGVSVIIQADEGDDYDDFSRLRKETDGAFAIQNIANSSSWETNLECNNNGNVELYYDNSKKLETYSSGVQVTGTLFIPDGGSATNRISIGDGGDLKLYHDGDNSFIKDAGTGRLSIVTSQLQLTNSADSEVMIKATENAAVELYYDNAEKLRTNPGGIKVTGNIACDGDNQKLILGAGDDLQLYHDGSHSYISDVGTGYLLIKGSEVQIQSSTGEDMAKFMPDAAVELYYDNSKKIETMAWGAKVTGNLEATGSLDVNEVTINGTVVLNSSRSLYNLGVLELADNIEARFGSSNDLKIYHNGSHTFFDNLGTGSVVHRVQNGDIHFQYYDGSSAEEMAVLKKNGGVELYYDNVIKLQTRASDVWCRDDLIFADSDKIKLGDGSDLELYHNGTHSFIQHTYASGNFFIESAANIAFKVATDESALNLNSNGTVELYYDNSKKLNTHTGGVTVTGYIQMDGTEGSAAAGNIYVEDNGKLVFGNGSDLQIYHDESHSYIAETGTGYLRIQAADYLQIGTASSAAAFLNCQATDGAVSINFNGSTKLETTSTGATVTGNFLPEADNTRNIGDGSTNFNSIWASTRFRGNDNVKLVLGNAQDLIIRHDGTDNLIESPTGDTLKIMMMGSSVDTADETAAKFVKDGAVELYYDNSKKLETKSTGVNIIGLLDVSENLYLYDNKKAYFGNGPDLEIYHDGTDSYIKNTTGELIIRDDIIKLKAVSTTDTYLEGNNGGAVALRWDNSVKFETTSWGADVGGTLRADTLQLDGDDQKLQLGADQDWEIYHDGTDNYFQTGAVTTHFRTDNGNRLTIKSDGNVMMQGSSGKNLEFKVATGLLTFTDNTKATFGTGDDLQIWADGSNSYIQHSGDGDLFVQATGADENLWLRAKDDVNIQANDNENAALFKKNGAVELYYDNAKKLETKSYGTRTAGVHNISQATNDTDFTNESGPGFTNGLIAENTQATNGVWCALTALAYNAATTNQSASFIAKSVSGGHRPEVYITQRTNSNANTAALFINTSGAVQLNYDGSSKLITDGNGVLISTGAYFLAGASCQFRNSWNSNTTRIRNQGANAANEGNLEFRTGADALALTIDKDQKATFAGEITTSRFETQDLGIKVIGLDGGTAQIDLQPDLGDSNADKWKVGAEDNGHFFISNKDSGAWDKSIAANRSGNSELYYDGSKKLETTSDGAKITGRLGVGVDASSSEGSELAIKSSDGATNLALIPNANTEFSSISFYNAAYDSQQGYIKYDNNDNSLEFRVNLATALEIDSSRNATFTGTVTCTSLTETSDIALKTNIEPITNVLDKINQITGYKYDFTSSNSSSIGVIAQDVEKVFPELVHGEEGSKSLQYSGLIGALIESVKELSAKVAALEAGS